MGPYKFQNPWGSMRDTYGGVSWDKHGFGIGNQYWAPKSKEQLRNEFLSAVAIALVAVGGPALAGGLGAAGGAATGAQAAGAAGQAALGTASAGGSGLATASALAGFLNSVAQNPPSVGQAIEPGNFRDNPFQNSPLQTPSGPRTSDSSLGNPVTHIQPQHPGQRFLDLLVEELDRNPQLLQLGKLLLHRRQTGQTDQDAVLSNPTLNRIANDAMNRVVGQVVREGEVFSGINDSEEIKSGVYAQKTIKFMARFHYENSIDPDYISKKGNDYIDLIITKSQEIYDSKGNFLYKVNTETSCIVVVNKYGTIENPITFSTRAELAGARVGEGGMLFKESKIIHFEELPKEFKDYIWVFSEYKIKNGESIFQTLAKLSAEDRARLNEGVKWTGPIATGMGIIPHPVTVISGAILGFLASLGTFYSDSIAYRDSPEGHRIERHVKREERVQEQYQTDTNKTLMEHYEVF